MNDTITIEKQKLINLLNEMQAGFDEYAENLESAERFHDAMNELWKLLIEED